MQTVNMGVAEQPDVVTPIVTIQQSQMGAAELPDIVTPIVTMNAPQANLGGTPTIVTPVFTLNAETASVAGTLTTALPVILVQQQKMGAAELPDVVTPIFTVNADNASVAGTLTTVLPVVFAQQGQMGATEQPDVVTPIFTFNSPSTNEGATPTVVTPTVLTQQGQMGAAELPDVVTPTLFIQQGQMGAAELLDVVTPIFTLNTPQANLGGTPTTVTPTFTLNALGGTAAGSLVEDLVFAANFHGQIFEDFADALTSPPWTVATSFATIDAGRARLRNINTFNDALETTDARDFRGSTIIVEVYFSDGGVDTDSYFAMTFNPRPNRTGQNSLIAFEVYGGNVHFRDYQVINDSIAYDPVDHRWFRVRDDGVDTVYVDTSPDGVTWTNRFSSTRTTQDHAASAFNIQAGYLNFGSNPGTPIYTYVDNLRVEPLAVGGAVTETPDVQVVTFTVNQQGYTVPSGDATGTPVVVTPIFTVNALGGAVTEQPDVVTVIVSSNQESASVAGTVTADTPVVLVQQGQMGAAEQIDVVVSSIVSNALGGAVSETISTEPLIIAGIYEDFSSPLTDPPWVDFGDYPAIVGGVARFDITPTAYAELVNNDPRNFMGKSIAWEMWATNNFTDGAVGELFLTTPTGNISVKVTNGTYSADVFGSNQTGPYNPVTMRWWRVREDSGFVYIDIASDGQTWVNLFTADLSVYAPYSLDVYSTLLDSFLDGADPGPGTYVYMDNIVFTAHDSWIYGGVAESPDTDALTTVTINSHGAVAEAPDTVTATLQIVNAGGAVVEQFDNVPISVVFNALTANLGGQASSAVVTFTMSQLNMTASELVDATTLTVLAQQIGGAVSETPDDVAVLFNFNALSANLGGALITDAITIATQQIAGAVFEAPDTVIVLFSPSQMDANLSVSFFTQQLNMSAAEMGDVVVVTIATQTLGGAASEAGDTDVVTFVLSQLAASTAGTVIEDVVVFNNNITSAGGSAATNVVAIVMSVLAQQLIMSTIELIDTAALSLLLQALGGAVTETPDVVALSESSGNVGGATSHQVTSQNIAFTADTLTVSASADTTPATIVVAFAAQQLQGGSANPVQTHVLTTTVSGVGGAASQLVTSNAVSFVASSLTAIAGSMTTPATVLVTITHQSLGGGSADPLGGVTVIIAPQIVPTETIEPWTPRILVWV